MSRKRPHDIDEMESNIKNDKTNQNGDHASSSREESPSFPVKHFTSRKKNNTMHNLNL